jgi:hypothetical protein
MRERFRLMRKLRYELFYLGTARRVSASLRTIQRRYC